jgi:hemoglobin
MENIDLSINPAKFGEKLPVQKPSPGILTVLKEDGIRKLVSDHYDLLVKSEIKHLFPTVPEQLEEAKLHAADFFIQVMGGPPYFNMRRGQPAMTKRHAQFKISAADREVWLDCYRQLLTKSTLPPHLIQSYWNYLNNFSSWMVNTEKAL